MTATSKIDTSKLFRVLFIAELDGDLTTAEAEALYEEVVSNQA